MSSVKEELSEGSSFSSAAELSVKERQTRTFASKKIHTHNICLERIHVLHIKFKEKLFELLLK